MGLVHKRAALERQCPFLPETDISGLGKQSFLCSHKGLRKKKKKAISERIQPGLNRRRCLLCVFVCHSLLQGEACLAWGLRAQEEIRPESWLDSSLEACCPGQGSRSSPPTPTVPGFDRAAVASVLCPLCHRSPSGTCFPSRNV